ncbi:RDD family protein [Aliikangiella marina]|uniref:RDD family protein n=1 Tax=Aliikangiella marina TaxID=1712262 RepID=A0A545T2H8_9GAMM|nr:RDD family protein [Aliikangiella marina]TQV71418.1 RDD family protein [Aliikangiella marina]
MEPNYTDYTYYELREALHSINREKFPERAERLKTLIQEKEATKAYKKEAEIDYESVKYSTFGLRFVASIIDGVVLFAFESVVTLIVKRLPESFTPLANIALQYDLLVYSILFHAYFGQTVGKMLVGVKVVRDSDEGPINFSHAFLRDMVPLILLTLLLGLTTFTNPIESDGSVADWYLYGVFVISSVAIFWSLVEMLSMLFNEKRRAIHDFIAGTVVIRCEPENEEILN